MFGNLDPVFKVEDLFFLKKDKTFDERFEKNNIIMVGRLTHQKNFDLIIDAYAENNQLKDKYKIFILGAGELENRLKNKVKLKNLDTRIVFLGHKKNVIKYIKNSKLFISSSLWEDPGFVIIEAALSNTSIISSDCPSGPNEIIQDGRNGYLVKNQDVNDLRKKMLNFPYDKFDYRDLVNSIKKNHIQKVFKRYEEVVYSFI